MNKYRQDVVILLFVFFVSFSGCATLKTGSAPSSEGIVTLAGIKEAKFWLPEGSESNQDSGKLAFQQVEKRIPIEGAATSLLEILADPSISLQLFQSSIDPVSVIEVQTGRQVAAIPVEMAQGDLGKIAVPSGSTIRLLTFDQWKAQPVYGFTLRPDGKVNQLANGVISISGLIKAEEALRIDATNQGESIQKASVENIFENFKTEGLEPDLAIVVRVVRNRIYRHYIPIKNNPFSVVPTQNGDKVVFANTLLLPEVIAGKASSKIKARLTEKPSSNRLRRRIFKR